MSNYSKDVFFEPWVGTEYKYGIKLEKGEIIGGTEDNKGLKVMVLGCDHYCIDDKPNDRNAAQKEYLNIIQNNLTQARSTIVKQALNSIITTLQKELPCSININNKDCAHLSICKQYTKEVIQNALDYAAKRGGWKEPDSHKRFREELFGENSSVTDWHKLLFFNFYQRSMPNENDSDNGSFMTTDEKIRGTKAFIEVVKNYEPDIIIIWGTDPQGSIYKNKNILFENNLFLRIEEKYNHKRNNKNQRPKIQINKNKYLISFNILQSKEKSLKPCLIIESYHSSGRALKYFNKSELHNSIIFALKEYETLIKAPENLSDTKNKDKEFICDIQKDIWINEKDFTDQCK